MKAKLFEELKLLKDLAYINKDEWKQFYNFIESEEYITRPQNKECHICTFFMPVHKQTKNIYLVHHIKANDWIPPGGHIELNENPIETVMREFQEELGHTLNHEPITLFNLSIKYINHPPGTTCKIHYDLWYSVEMDEKTFFIADQNEFYDAKWMNLNDVLKLTTEERYRQVIQNYLK